MLLTHDDSTQNYLDRLFKNLCGVLQITGSNDILKNDKIQGKAIERKLFSKMKGGQSSQVFTCDMFSFEIK